MGLDMYAYTTTRDLPTETDFPVGAPNEWYERQAAIGRDAPGDETYDGWGAFRADEKIAYWRKHPNLHGSFQQVYERRGGNDLQFGSFSGPIQLSENDIDALEEAVISDALPHTEGFFFGESQPTHKKPDLEFIAAARAAFAEGKKIYYYASW